MKKSIKQILSLLLVALMAVSLLGTAAFATEVNPPAEPETETGNNSIAVTGTKVGEVLTLYRMFDLSVDDESDPKAFRYTVNADWTAFFTGEGAGAAYVTLDATDGHVTWKEGMDTAEKMIALGQAASAYATANSLQGTSSGELTGTSYTFEGLVPGYYLITSTLGTKAIIDTTPSKPAPSIAEKNPEDTIDKQVQEDSTEEWGTSNDAQVGDTVNFKSTVTLQPYTTNVKVHDTMTDGLAINADSILIEGLTKKAAAADDAEPTGEGSEETEEAAYDYEVLVPGEDGETFTVIFSDSYLASLTAQTELVITYNAILTEAAIVTGEDGTAVVDQNNKTKVTFGNKQTSTEKTTETKTYSFEVFKHATDSEENLGGAVFQLQKAGTAVKLFKIDDQNYRVATAAEITAAGEDVVAYSDELTAEELAIANNKITDYFITTDEDNIVILGVDNDDDYTLVELRAPDGFNKLSSAVEVTVGSDNAYKANVENKSGTELPGTGGIGTTIFYIVGSLLVVGAGVVLITKKRMGKDA